MGGQPGKFHEGRLRGLEPELLEFADAAFKERTTRPEAYCPIDLFHVWEWFLMVLDVEGGTVDRLSSNDIMLDCGMLGAAPNPRELALLQRLHSRYRAAMTVPRKAPLQEAKPTDVDATKALFGLKSKKANG